MGAGGDGAVRDRHGRWDADGGRSSHAGRRRIVVAVRDDGGGLPSTTNLRFALRAGVAIADWFHAPEVDEVDLSAWTGGVGEALPSHHRDWVQWW